jgi:hypothetical protein
MNLVEFKNFRDSKNKLLISYWSMNKGETFITCDLSKTSLQLGSDNQIEDYGCTFVTTGSYTIQEIGTDTITTIHAGDSLNRRPLKSILITALEDNSKWCYSLHVNSLFTTNESEGVEWECPSSAKTLNGEQIKISAGETIQLLDKTKDIYIANPICDSELNTITYKSSSENNFTNLNFGKYLKIKKGEVFNIQSTIDTYIPKLYYITTQR